MAGTLSFDAAKALETLLYVVQKTHSDLYGSLKLLYVADKLHLERYGSLMFGEDYAAMEWGPVPSNIYDIVKFVRGDRPRSLSETAKNAFRMEGKINFVLLRKPDLEELSASNIECLDEAIKQHGLNDFDGFKRLTHDRAWQAAWRSAGQRRSNPIPLVSVASLLPNAQELIQHLSDPNPGAD
jgi:uncharacterized phage-associated protein